MAGTSLNWRGRSRTCATVVLAALTLAATAAHAAPPVMTPSLPGCLSNGGNALVSLSLKPETGWSSVRVYFRRAGLSDFYYLEMRSDGRGGYWATLPRPDAGTHAAEIQLATKDAEGAEVRSALQKADVTSSCSAALSPEQERFARNLVVGETATAQAGQTLNGWECTGVVSRINVDGQLRPDSVCRAVIVAQAANSRDKVLLPLAILGGGVVGGVIVHNREHEETSKPRP